MAAPLLASPLSRRLLLVAGALLQVLFLSRLLLSDLLAYRSRLAAGPLAATARRTQLGARPRAQPERGAGAEALLSLAAEVAATEVEVKADAAAGREAGTTAAPPPPKLAHTAGDAFLPHPLCPRLSSFPPLQKTERRRTAALREAQGTRRRRRLAQAMGESKDHINKLGKKERLEAKRLIALEDERTSVSWRMSWCAAEKSAAKASPIAPNTAKELRSCLRAGSCDTPSARRALQRLAGIAAVRTRARGAGADFPCVFANRALCPVNRTVRARETGVSYDDVPYDLPLPDTDPDVLFDTCAVVGNGARTETVEGAARLIDAHDAVIRMNDMMRFGCAQGDTAALCAEEERRFANASRAGVADTSDTLAHVWGAKTTLRVLNKKHAEKLMQLGVSAHAAGKAKYAPSEGEAMVFWNHASVKVLPQLSREFVRTRLYLLSADALDWMVRAYAALRSDAHRLGLGPPSCYVTLSTGVHAMLLAAQLCRRVHLYGFSPSEDEAYDRVHLRLVSETPSVAHDWWFDGLLVRLLHDAGLVSACS